MVDTRIADLRLALDRLSYLPLARVMDSRRIGLYEALRRRHGGGVRGL
ncbi:hypothetical protein AB0D11_47995 [Streptomyces monashensis]